LGPENTSALAVGENRLKWYPLENCLQKPGDKLFGGMGINLPSDELVVIYHGPNGEITIPCNKCQMPCSHFLTFRQHKFPGLPLTTSLLVSPDLKRASKNSSYKESVL